jgi:LPS-assembly protein
MKNNFKIFFLLISFLIVLPTILNGNEKFNFDVTEVEITEKGNKFKGLKRGTVTTDDGIIITADTFDYDKVSNILNAKGDVKIDDTLKDIIIYSDNITYLKNEDKVFTKNNSKAVDGEFIITADTFDYDKVSNILNAKGDVKIDDTLKDIIIYSDNITYLKNEDKVFTKGKTEALIESKYNFMSSDVLFLRDKKELSSSSKTRIINEKIKSYELDEFVYYIDDKLVKGSNIKINSNIKVAVGETDHLKFKNGFFNLKDKTHKASTTNIKLRKDNFENPENDPRLVGVSSSSTKNKTFINKGVFTSCKQVDGKCPPWSIKADKITHDKIKKQLSYDKAFLRVYDVPVMYFPKFFHPDPTVKRQTGFLKPQLNKSEILGSSIYIPYFKVISENKDLTFKPTIFDSNIYMLQNEYRQVNKNSSFVADVGLTKGYKSSLENSNRNSMSHIFAKYNLNLNWDNFSLSRLNFFGEKVSNDTYLKVFDNNLMGTANKPTDFNSLKSGIVFNLENEDYVFEAGSTIYEDLQVTKNSDRFQFVLPYYRFSRELFTEKNLGGTISYSSSGSNVLGSTNNLVTGIGQGINYTTYDYILNSGIKNFFSASFSNSNQIATHDSKIKTSPQIEARSIFQVQSSFPLIKKEKFYVNTIEPRLSFRINPGDMNKYTNDERKINVDNIFNINRLALGDSYEAGKSLTLGINYKKEKIANINKYFEFKLATVLRDTEENRIPIQSTLNRKTSNIFGSMNYNMNENFSIDYDFSIDNNLNTFEYNSISATFDGDKLFTKFDFIEENGTIGSANSIESELGYNFDDYNLIKFKTRRNRTLNLTEYYDLVYEYKNDCLIAGFKYKKTYYQDRDLKPKEDLLLSITFFPLSTFEQEIDQQLYRN